MNLTTLTRLLAVLITAIIVSACASIRPELTTLYKTENVLAEQPPVILIHGAFGGRLCDSNAREHWPGSVFNLLLSDYRTLAVNTPDSPMNKNSPPLSVCGLTDNVAGNDFYGEIEATLTGPGGYLFTDPGAPVTDTQRRYYRFTYDWRQDNSLSAAKLDALVEQIRRDHGNEALQVDIVAHSMGGLVTRYWLRYGTTDVLDNNDFQINNVGTTKARKVILVGTPNLGSTSALQQILTGADFGVNTIAPEILLTFPSAYQLLPHPIARPILNITGQSMQRDIYDVNLWRALEWGPFDPQVRKRLQKHDWGADNLAALELQVGKLLERARRFVWSLTVENSDAQHELIVFGGDCMATPARILIEDIDDDSRIRLWPHEIERPQKGVNYRALMLEPGDGAVTKASLLARTALDPSIPRHRYSDFPLDYSVMFCGDHTKLPGNITFQDNLLHILLSR